MIDPNNTYKNEFNTEYNKWLETFDYDYKAKENKTRYAGDRANYIIEHLDHERWSHRLDEELFARFVAFYEQAIK